MKRIILFGLGGVVLLVILAAGYFWYSMSKPFYQPGMLRQAKNLRAPLAPPAQAAGADFWQVEPDIRLYHFAQGNGRNVLVVHGGPGIPFSRPVSGLQPLGGVYQFHYYDQRGCGQSTRPFDRFDSPNTYQNMTVLERTLGLGAQIADIERIRQILGEEKLILIGHSWGGFLAALYAAEFPDRVEALVLVSPATTLVMPQEEDDLFGSVRARLPEDQQAGFDLFMKEYMDFNALFKKSEADLVAMNARFGEYYQAVQDTPLPDQGQSGGWMVWAQYLSMGSRHDYRKALAEVTAPVLVMHGADDLQSEAASRMYADAFPNPEFMVIQEAGHFSFEEQPTVFAHLIGDFLDGLQ